MRDVASIIDLVESAYRLDVLDFLGEGQRTSPGMIAALIVSQNNRLILAERNNELVSCCLLERQVDSGYFSMFAVHPDRQGQGIGAAMLIEAERIVREEWGCDQIRLSAIRDRKRLISWYERIGYRHTDGQEILTTPDRETDILMDVLMKAFI